MPTIELTDEQAEELRDVLHWKVDQLTANVRALRADDPDSVEYRNLASVLSDILHLLEIA
jgi:hypothetical protein